ncbi:MAG: ParA family protein [Hyphomonadaceae bacterium]|jgi:chromosome partitioning protein|nr:ParA family protein [Hyphomonadaceae bacterium]
MLAPKPRVIVLAASKGGSGKTSLTASLAVRAMKDGARVALVDAEPQKSLTLWWSLRGKPGNPFLHAYSGDPVEDADALKAEGYQWIFIDTVPAMVEHIERAIEAADLVIIPTRVSAFDLVAARAVVGFCKLHGEPFAFVLNATDPKWKKGIQSAIAMLKKLGPVVPKSIRHRTVYASAITAGKTGPEARDTKEAKGAADEIGAVWTTIRKMASAAVRAK